MEFKGYTLNPFQVRAAEAIEAGHNVLLSAPTGAGKTLVAEYAIDLAIQRGRRVLYTAPIKALSNQKFRDFQEQGLDVGLMTGDLTLAPGAQVVIMTTEIFRNAVFEAPERFDDVDYVIFDEIHFLDDPERGTVWEESLIFAPDQIRIVGLSATIANLAQFGRWLEEVRPHDLEVIRHEKRPVPLDQKLFHPEIGMFQLAQRKRAQQTVERARRAERARPRQDVQHGRGERGRRGPSRRVFRGPHPTQLVLDQLQREELTPILYFCFSRKECEIKAERNLHRELLTRRDRARMQEVFFEICRKFELDAERDPALRAIEMRALRGIGYHHAGMLPIHKEVVERLFTSGLLRLLFTTETFALGINMPARTVVFDALRKFDGVSFDYMPARDYMQMAGRAGRQGIDKAGLVVSILDDEALIDAPLSDLFGGKVEPIQSRFNLSYSTIINLFARMGFDLLDAYDRSFAAFQAGSGSQKRRDRTRSRARAALRAKIAVLAEAGYLDREEGGLFDRGKIAQQINGYEIQVTELLFDGVLDDCDMHQLAAVFTAIVHEPRRGQERHEGHRILPADIVRRAEHAVRRFAAVEIQHGFEHTIKPIDFGQTIAVMAWSQGAPMRKIEHLTGADGGDFVRTLRMAIQMMRQLRAALTPDYPLYDRLAEAIVTVNRDEVDAKRQFELG